MSELLKNIIRGILLILLQVFVLNKILVHEYVTPYLYILFVLLLPFQLPRWALLFCGLLLGLCLDMFMNTEGMHAAACVLMAYLRPFVMNLFSPQGGFELVKKTPSVRTMGWRPFMLYAAVLTFVHHLLFFVLEIFDFHFLFYMAFKVALSTILTLVLVLLWEMLFHAQRK